MFVGGDLELRCSCGTVRGVVHGVARRHANRAVCYCDDCQSFAHFLGHAGEILDAYGGTPIVQLSPARLELAAGAEQLRVMRLTAKGALRWYTACCSWPIGNTLATRQVPFLGLIETAIEAGQGADAIDLTVGPVHARAFARFARGDTSVLEKVYKGPPIALALRLAGLMVRWRLRGDHKRSPFFDAETSAPVSAPHVLSPAQLAAVVGARDGVRG